MGIVILIIILFIVAIVATINYNYNESGVVMGIACVAWIFAIVFALSSFAYLIETSEDSQCYDEYWSLATLKPSVEASNDETLRFYYFQRVEKYNKGYDTWKFNRESFWFSWITGNKYNDCERIEFELRPGDSTGPRIEVPYD